jgi:FtsH-binding integral membrane protein
MAYSQAQTMNPVINELEDVRADFVVRVYQHVLLAVGVFVAFETVLFMTGIAETFGNFVFGGGGMTWLLILGGFMVGQFIVGQSVANMDNPSVQYAGLFGSAALYSVLFSPILWYSFRDGSQDVVMAAVVTAVGFAGLTVIGFITRKDLSFMRPLIMWGSFAAMGAILISLFTNAQLGVWFSVAMIALSGAAILYQTQAIVRQYPAWAHIAAAVGLFSSLMTMFYYVLRLFMRR